MEYGVVSVPAAPVRRKPRHQSEMVSQLLFGETVRIIRSKGSLWVKVRSLHDDYEGWMTNTLLIGVTGAEAKFKPRHVTNVLAGTVYLDSKRMHVPVGSSLPAFENGMGLLGRHEYRYNDAFVDRIDVKPGPERILQLTSEWLNAPYMWGGRTLMGVDCSGFAQVNFKMMGIDLPRDAWQQAQAGTTVKKFKDAVCGDLAFFDDKDEIVHVGILLGNEKIIHASGKVRIDTIDKKGIINSDTGKRSHSLESIKRYW